MRKLQPKDSHIPTRILPQQLGVLPSVKEPQAQRTGSDKEQQRGVGEMPRGVAQLGLLGLVDPDAGDLAQAAAYADVDGDGQADGSRAEDVGRQPAEQGRDAAEGARGAEDQAAVARGKGGWREDARDEEADAAHGGADGRVNSAGVEVIGRVRGNDLHD